jgi:hypothetical protein
MFIAAEHLPLPRRDGKRKIATATVTLEISRFSSL